MNEEIRVVIIDDHFVVREGVRNLLARNPTIKVVEEGSAGNHVLELVQTHLPDVLITDLLMPAHVDEPKGALFEPVSTLKQVVEDFPQTAIVVLSQEDDIQIIQSLAEVGVRGYLLKTDAFAQVLDHAIASIHRGASYFSPEVNEVIFSAPELAEKVELTPRQLDVVRAIAQNPAASREQIAQELHITSSTLSKHITAIFEALDVPNMESCIIKAMRMRLISVKEVMKGDI